MNWQGYQKSAKECQRGRRSSWWVWKQVLTSRSPFWRLKYLIWNILELATQHLELGFDLLQPRHKARIIGLSKHEGGRLRERTTTTSKPNPSNQTTNQENIRKPNPTQQTRLIKKTNPNPHQAANPNQVIANRNRWAPGASWWTPPGRHRLPIPAAPLWGGQATTEPNGNWGVPTDLRAFSFPPSLPPYISKNIFPGLAIIVTCFSPPKGGWYLALTCRVLDVSTSLVSLSLFCYVVVGCFYHALKFEGCKLANSLGSVEAGVVLCVFVGQQTPLWGSHHFSSSASHVWCIYLVPLETSWSVWHSIHFKTCEIFLKSPNCFGTVWLNLQKPRLVLCEAGRVVSLSGFVGSWPPWDAGNSQLLTRYHILHNTPEYRCVDVHKVKFDRSL